MSEQSHAPHPAAAPLLTLLLVAALSGCNDAPPPGGSASPDQAVAPGPGSAAAAPTGVDSAKPATDPTATPDGSASAAPTDGADSAGPAAPGKADATGPDKAAAPEEKPGAVKSDKKVEAQYAVWLQSAGRYTTGKASTVQAVLMAKGAFKCNEKYPYKFKLGAPPAGVTYPEKIARKISSGTKQRVLSVPFTPTTAGKKTISGTFYFSVCNEATCKIQKKPMAVTIEVHEN